MEMAGLATALEATGRSVIHLEVGQPSSPGARRRCGPRRSRALERDQIGYTNAPGPAVAAQGASPATTADWYGVDVDPGQVVVTAGASAGFTLAFLACFDPGDRVGVVEPGYPCYRNTLFALGIEPVAIPVGPETRWAPTPELLDAAGPLAGPGAWPARRTRPGPCWRAERLADLVGVVRRATTCS